MDPKRVATKDGVHSTNMVSIEPGYYLDATYEVTLLQNAIGSTGRLKVIRLVPREGAGISFLGRWDEGAKKGTRRKGPNAVPSLDFDAVDADDNVRSRIRFVGHHSKCLGDQRFDVEIRINPENKLVFKGVVRGSAWFPDARRVWGVPPDVWQLTIERQSMGIGLLI
jgi:hypothetical protein